MFQAWGFLLPSAADSWCKLAAVFMSCTFFLMKHENVSN
ncbi:hypothetical protein LHK_00675 [Laribacter hongkongensis HLHK9]|uniref:Uncharacterized protein n=2 Tax=Laribacter hongkongensis TaxID=168471 RepID=C1DD33_LARHH|nr:hypothetical protein LHK_00675 [Laribacter hongkongensis HLHK9]ASJ23498.1 hypothetical protein LHGZ1_0667 [Laribacter hongkongensis]